MTARMPFLRGLRRSVLGAWLAVAYALAVLASGLAPSPASARGVADGTVLCSGQTLPGQDAPEPAGEPAHCKACPANPALAGTALVTQPVIVRLQLDATAERMRGTPARPAGVLGLPPSHAPPAAAIPLI